MAFGVGARLPRVRTSPAAAVKYVRKSREADEGAELVHHDDHDPWRPSASRRLVQGTLWFASRR